jgi:malonate transporter and related proteins
MSAVLQSLIPVFLVIMTGWIAKRSGLVPDSHWPGFEKVTYHILFPALVITTLVTADLSRVPVLTIGAAMLFPVVFLTVCLLATRQILKRSIGLSGPSFTSVLQGAVRWNTFVAVALAAALLGQRGVAMMSVAIAVVVPFVNVVSAFALAKYGSQGGSIQPAKLAMELIKIPFIWSTAVGLAINITGLPVPTMLVTYGDIIGRAALAAGLLMVGAGLQMEHLRQVRTDAVLASILKLVAMPLIAFFTARALGLPAEFVSGVMLFACVPTAAAGYILARQNGGDAPLMASIITQQTVLAMLTIPFWLSIIPA